MDYKIVWSDRSLTHLRDLVEYIAHDNPFAAETMAEKILKKTSLLAQFPQLGPVYLKSGRDDVRQISTPPYRIFYQIIDADRTISILAVWHGVRQEPEIQ